MGYFKPASLNDLIDREAIGKEYHYTTEYTANIEEGDVLTIESQDYNVKAVNKKKALSEIKYTFSVDVIFLRRYFS